MDLNETIKILHPFEIKILSTWEIPVMEISHVMAQTGFNEGQARSGLNWLEGKGLIRRKEMRVVKKFSLASENAFSPEKGLIEIAIAGLLRREGPCTISGIMEKLSYDKSMIGSAVGYMKKSKELIQDGQNIVLSPSYAEEYYQRLGELIGIISEKKEIREEELAFSDLEILTRALTMPLVKTRLRHKEQEIHTYEMTENGQSIKSRLREKAPSGKEISQITPELLRDKAWKGMPFREYNIHLPGPRMTMGRKHPYREFLDRLKKKFMELGFEEIRGSIVETEFWNMDALFMPQTHPARDIHDVYFVENPASAREIEEPFFARVKKVHENGSNTGSRGWGYRFDAQKARQLILRSQGTVLSARQLSRKPRIPGKYFAIARCFRYDQVDATHLADFFQVEGIVIGKTANFPSLLGLLKTFAGEIALADEIKFVPAYFPFTEPSVELHIRHPRVGWYELGGAGIFRPEVTLPLGVDVPVIAWGLGVDRMAMMALGIDDIRDLFSRDLELIRKTRMVL